MRRYSLALVLFAASLAAQVPSNGLGALPYMAIGTWYQYGGSVTQSQFCTLATTAVSDGMLAAGYKILILEEPKKSRVSGHLVLDPTNFPGGWSAVAACASSNGFIFGTYTSPATTTCGGNPGSGGNETTDANDFASIGVRYLENDWCQTFVPLPAQEVSAISEYETMGNALIATGQPILYNIYGAGAMDSPQWFNSFAGGNAARLTADILPMWHNSSFSYPTNGYSPNAGIADVAFLYLNWNTGFSGPGHYFMGDQLVMGCGTCVTNPGTLSTDEAETQMSFWAMASSPLQVGTDLVNASGTTLSILENSEVIAVDQDPLGIVTNLISEVACGSSFCDVYAKRVKSGWIVGMFNRDTASHSITSTFSAIDPTHAAWNVRDLWAHSDLGSMSSYTTTVNSHGVSLVSLTAPRSEFQKGVVIQKAVVQ